MKKYEPQKIEPEWQEKWHLQGLYKFEIDKTKGKYYTLVELPYPSGDLHLGHWFAFSPADAHARFKRMSGLNVFFPNGFDAFGLPAENAAIKRNIHPKDWTMGNIKTMRHQFATMGTMIDWSHEAITCLPEYYKWNQWIFLKMYEKGLAYRDKAMSNWCPSCQTVLANENIENGLCWRCGSEVVQKEIEQWFLKITDYADKLIWDNTDREVSNGVKWPKSVREGQNNWIGKSDGASVEFPLKNDYNYILLHGFGGTPELNFLPAVKNKLESLGLEVHIPALPNTDNPTEEEQVSFVLNNIKFDSNTILYGHSLGSVVAMKVVEKLDKKIAGLILSGTFAEPKFIDHPRPFENTFSWKFDSEKIKKNTGFIKILHDMNDDAVPQEQAFKVAEILSVLHVYFVEANSPHFDSKDEPAILKALVPSLEVFTTRPDTIYGATFMVVSPEHPLIQGLISEENKELASKNPQVKEVSDYALKASKKTEIERKESKEKTGVSTGLIAINPVSKEEIPIWVADYVLMGYGTGAIMAVPAHDDRDYEFARKFDLPLKVVIVPDTNSEFRIQNSKLQFKIQNEWVEGPFVGDGQIIGSNEWDGLKMPEEIGKVIDYLEQKGLATPKTEYHLHDWSISRQRYWGTPVPMIHCPECGVTPVPLKDLPVELPYEVDYTPKGKPPLATDEKWLNVKCPECGGPAKRDAETLDTFFDSAWYYYRYTDPKFDKLPFNPELVKGLLPVDIYFGGSEHTLGHTLYARFFTKFFKDIGLVGFDEFAHKRFQHGIILGPDGNRMSKSRGNVVNPDDVVKLYGADTVRLYLCFMMPHEATAPWDPGAITGVYRFLKRIWELKEKVSNEASLSTEDQYQMHRTIKKVGDDLDQIKFNTAVASLMEWLNHLSRKEKISLDEYKTLLLLLAPFAPHITEELYQGLKIKDLGYKKEEQNNTHKSSIINHKSLNSIHLQPWPIYDEKNLHQKTVSIVVQINGKVRDTLKVESSKTKDQSEIEKMAKESERVKKYLEGKEIKKAIYIEAKLLNFVV